MNLTNKKAAMFGIDARIALVIFSVLSIVSGATIFSAIEKSEISRIIQQADEVKKAESQFYQDTGITAAPYDTNTRSLRVIRDLVSNPTNIEGWKGPYLPLKSTATSKLETSQGEFIALRVASEDATWGGSTNITNFTTTCPNKPCYLWIHIEVETDAIADGIEEAIDGNNDRDSGNVRVRDAGVIGTTKPSVFIKHRYWEE